MPRIARPLFATVERVGDGDTVLVLNAYGTKLRIRLLGIDAPEIASGAKPGHPCGKEARAYLDHLIGGKTIQVDAFGSERYKRILAVVRDGPVNINPLMVVMGYAKVYRDAAAR